VSRHSVHLHTRDPIVAGILWWSHTVTTTTTLVHLLSRLLLQIHLLLVKLNLLGSGRRRGGSAAEFRLALALTVRAGTLQ
jgi:hypothetical protein